MRTRTLTDSRGKPANSGIPIWPHVLESGGVGATPNLRGVVSARLRAKRQRAGPCPRSRGAGGPAAVGARAIATAAAVPDRYPACRPRRSTGTQAWRPTNSVRGTFDLASAINDAGSLGPVGGGLRPEPANEPTATAHPAGEKADGCRQGRQLCGRFRSEGGFWRGLGPHLRVHRLFELLDQPIEHGGFRELEFLRREGLLEFAHQEVLDERVQFRRGDRLHGSLRPWRGRFRSGLDRCSDESRATRGTQGHLPRHRGAAARTDGSRLGDQMVEFGNLLIPRDVLHERVRGGPELLGDVRLTKFLRLNAQLSDLDFSRVRRRLGGSVERFDRFVVPSEGLQEEGAGIVQVWIRRHLDEATVVEREERPIPFRGKLPPNRFVHLLLVERGTAFKARGCERGGDATAERTIVLLLEDEFPRALRRGVLDQVEGREHLPRGDGAYFGNPSKVLGGRPRKLPEGVVSVVDDRLRTRRVQAQDFEQVE